MRIVNSKQMYKAWKMDMGQTINVKNNF